MAYEDELRIVLVDEVGSTSATGIGGPRGPGGQGSSFAADTTFGRPGGEEKRLKDVQRELLKLEEKRLIEERESADTREELLKNEKEILQVRLRLRDLDKADEKDRRGRIEKLATGIGRYGATTARTLASAEGEGGLAAVSGTAMHLAKMAPVAGLAVAGLVGLGMASKALVDSFLERAQQLAAYSPEIAQAQAYADVRSTLLDIQEAQELGPAMAEMIDAQSDLSAAFRELMLPIKKFVVEILAAGFRQLVEIVNNIYKVGIGTKEAFAVLGESLIKAWDWKLDEAGTLIGTLPDRVAKAMAEALAEKSPSGVSLMDRFFAVNQFTGIPKTPDTLELARDMGLNIPGFRFAPGVAP